MPVPPLRAGQDGRGLQGRKPKTKPRRARKAYKLRKPQTPHRLKALRQSTEPRFQSHARILRNEANKVVCAALLALVVGCKSTDEFSLLPGQAMVVSNPRPRAIRVTALYPVRIIGPGCRATHAVDFTVTCDAGQFTVTDDRPALLIWSQANHVTVSVSAF